MYLNKYQFFKKKETAALISLILLSVIIRIPIILIFGDTSLEHEWKTLVNNLIEHGVLSYRNFDGFLVPNLWMPPLYSYYLYLFSVFDLGEQYYVKLILLSQILLSSISVIIFYKINEIFFSKKISFYSALLFSIFPLHVYACSQISSASLQSFFTILFFYFFLKFTEKKNFLLNILLSITAGFLILLRGEFLALLLLSLLYSYFFLKVSIKKILIVILITLITVSPYLIRNILVFEKITITKSFGYNLWKGNNPNSTVEGSTLVRNDLAKKIDKIDKNKFYEINFDKIFLNQATKNIIEEPKRYFILFFKKLLSFIFIDLQSTQPNYYNIFHYLPLLLIGLTSITGIILYDRKSYRFNYLILVFVANVIIFSSFFILPRYKLAILPLQIIFSNVLVDYIYNKFFNRHE